MNQKEREAMRLALEALINGKNVRAGEGGTKHQTPLEDAAIEQLRAALAEPEVDNVLEQEVFVWYDDETGETWTPGFVQDFGFPVGLRPLYAAPSSREWVPLTDEEKRLFSSWLDEKPDAEVFAAIEATLKEKNHG